MRGKAANKRKKQTRRIAPEPAKSTVEYVAVDPQKLRSARPEGLNAANVAKGAGVSRQLLWYYENPTRKLKQKVRLVPKPVLDYLCTRYGVPVEQVTAPVS